MNKKCKLILVSVNLRLLPSVFFSFVICLFLTSTATHSEEYQGQVSQLLSMDLRNLLQVEIATGEPVELYKAPAVATVITAQDIQNMGARNLVEVLNTVPGLHAGRNSQVMAPKFSFRGITSTFTPQTLMMVNGVALTSVVRGDRQIAWGQFPIHSVQRIEIIRGPHSALYGADAFAGVINIITKTGEDIKNSSLGGTIGSFSTAGVWASHSMNVKDWNVGLNIEYVQSDGYEESIESDGQTVIDQLGDLLFENGELPFDPQDASLAPGHLNMQYKSLDVWMTAQNAFLNVDLGIQQRRDLGSGQGLNEALDPYGVLGGDRHLLQVKLTPQSLTDDLSIEAKAHYVYSSQLSQEPFRLLPPGTLFGSFPQGIIGGPETHEYTLKLEGGVSYTGIKNHTISVGVGFDKQDLFKITDSTNFNPDLTPRTEGLVNVSDTPEAFLPEESRTNRYAFIQDIYSINDELTLTSGFRFDDYSDFGSTTNPRFALVWSLTDNITTKLLYGRAFRAPSFAETLVIANPVSLGNPNLQPEIIDTYELSLGYQSKDHWELNTNLFQYDIKDFITFVPDPGATTATAQNVGRRVGYGLESEFTYLFSQDWHLTANYAYVKTKDDIAKDDVGDYPNHKAYMRSNWSLSGQLQAHIQATYVGERKRIPGDIRKPLDGYLSIDAGLRYEISEYDLEVELLGKNIFDEDIREPSQGSTDNGITPVNIPNDLPQAGRSLAVRMTKYF